jgi:hypothetical protein
LGPLRVAQVASSLRSFEPTRRKDAWLAGPRLGFQEPARYTLGPLVASEEESPIASTADMRKEQLIRFIDQVISQGETIRRESSSGKKWESLGTNWYPRIMSVFHLLGSRADPWKSAVAKCPADSSPAMADKLLGVLKAIREAVDGGLLAQIEDSAHAEAFESLLKKGESLARDGHLIAAGAVGQSVLEEHLREWCVRTSSTGGRASAAELSSSLNRNGHLTKAEMETAAALSAVGEHCVRNGQPPLARQEVQKMLDGVREFLLAHPLP